MYVLSYLHFLSFALYCTLGVYVWSRNPTSRLNRACTAFIMCLAAWSLAYVFAHFPLASRETAQFWTNLCAIGWVGLGGAFFWFVNEFVGSARPRGRLLYHSLVSLPLALLVAAQWMRRVAVMSVPKPYGWEHEWAPTIWSSLFFAYYLCMFATALGRLLQFRRTSSQSATRRQTGILLVLTTTCLVLASITNTLLPLLKIHGIPSLGNMITLIWAAGLSYAIVKYKFLTITAVTAAENILSTMSDMLILTDPDGTIVKVNRAARETLAGESYRLDGSPISRLAIEDGGFDQGVFATISNIPVTNYRMRLKTMTGDSVRVILSSSLLSDERGETAGVVVVAKDISALIEVERELRVSEERYRDLVENINEVLYTVDSNGIVTYVSPTIEEMAGFRPEELVGRPIVDLAMREERELVAQRVANVLEGAIDKGTYRLPRRDGSFAWVQSSGRPIVEKGVVIGAHGVLADISEQVKIADEKRLLEQQLHRAQKMEAIGTLAGGVAHDLNNILSGIVSYPELLMLDLAQDSPMRKPLQVVRDSGRKAAAIVQDLLTMARRGVQNLDIVNLNPIVSRYLKSPEYLQERAQGPHVRVQTNLAPDLLNIEGSEVHLTKTVMNLVTNAFEAMPDGGALIISTENRYLEESLMGEEEVRPGDYAILTVSDSGIGIAPQDLERIFEPFYTKKTMGRSGSGLGMAVVWGTVKDHLGYIDVRSKQGKGTEFSLYFPVTLKTRIEQDGPVPFESYQGKGESILVVDDVPEQCEIACAMLAKLGYAAESVASGEAAIQRLTGWPVDLLVLDMIMAPGMDGLDTYRRILRIRPGQKAILASGFSETERARQTIELGAAAYIKKPYTLEKIGLAVRQALDDNSSRPPSPHADRKPTE